MSATTVSLRTITLVFITAAGVHCSFAQQEVPPSRLFSASTDCQACHNGLADRNGDASIGVHWRASVMANASNDPYWRASVQRETVDHPDASAAIEDKCATCHMPMARIIQQQNGTSGQVFAHLPNAFGRLANPVAPFAKDGVSCTVCHQITDKRLGTSLSFSGGFHVDVTQPPGAKRVFGPFDIEPGVAHIMNSSTGYTPQKGNHIQQAEFCATCHTLYTHALGENSSDMEQLAEQVPFLEWRHSDYADASSCQECHMTAADGAMAISSVLGAPRENVQKHIFKGGNFFLLSMLSTFCNDLFLQANTAELQNARIATIEQLQKNAATIAVSVGPAQTGDGQLSAMVTVENLAGHKLPTAYPSRRVWIHFTVQDDGGTIFESGRLYDGKIRGNNNDRDARKFEPHYDSINNEEQVQIYEAILADNSNRVTTGLLNATTYLKDNRITPSGFDKETANGDIAVKGAAREDISFADGGDKINYMVPIGNAEGPFRVTAELWYQPIGYRWAANLNGVAGKQTARFSRMYKKMDKRLTAIRLATATQKVTLLPSLQITAAERATAARLAAEDTDDNRQTPH